MKKIIFRAPVQTASGYGVYARSILRALDKSGKFDITVMSVPWGATPLVYDNTPEMNRISELAKKFNPNGFSPDQYDASVQVTIPNEFTKLGKKNICVTAGIEVDKVAPLWHTRCNDVADVVVVPSAHAARSFTEAIYNSPDGAQLLLKKPLYIAPISFNEKIFNTIPQDPDPRYNFPAPFNFVAVGLGLDRNEGSERKNFFQLIRWFCEQFRGSQDVGLVLKLSMVNNSALDRINVLNRVHQIKAQTGCGQFPRIHLIHGRLSDEELAALYKTPNVKAYITLTHGEGYGLPILEAAACGLPVIATDWSGHLDFLTKDGKKLFVPVSAELKDILPETHWKDVYEPGTKWAFPIESDTKMKMAKVVVSYDKPKQWAEELAEHISKTFTDEALMPEFVSDMEKLINDEKVCLTKNLLVKNVKVDKTLPVTLVAAAGVKIPETVAALKNSNEQIKFESVKFFTPQGFMTGAFSLLDTTGVEVIPVASPMASVADYDNFVLKEMHKHVNTSHILMTQWDGYVLNGSAWDDEFMKYDFVGAPWFWNNVVGNAGFCLMSKKLLEELSHEEYEAHPLDTNICMKYRQQLEMKGFKFAPPDLASKFSVENGPHTGQFGWHGKNPNYGI